MSDYWKDRLVLGGARAPRVLLIENELCENPDFESNIDGWEGSHEDMLERTEDTTSFYGDYCLKIIDDQDDARCHGYYTVSFDEALAERSFIASFWARKDGDEARISIGLATRPDEGTFTSEVILVTNNWRFFVVQGKVGSGVTEVELRLYIYPVLYSNISGTDSVYIDEVSIREISEDILVSDPDKWNQSWDEEVQAEQELLSGSFKRRISGVRYRATLRYNFLNATEEREWRQICSEDQILFFPHREYSWHQLVWQDGSFDVKYYGDQYVGHSLNVTLEAVKLVGQRPVND